MLYRSFLWSKRLDFNGDECSANSLSSPHTHTHTHTHSGDTHHANIRVISQACFAQDREFIFNFCHDSMWLRVLLLLFVVVVVCCSRCFVLVSLCRPLLPTMDLLKKLHVGITSSSKDHTKSSQPPPPPPTTGSNTAPSKIQSPHDSSRPPISYFHCFSFANKFYTTIEEVLSSETIIFMVRRRRAWYRPTCVTILLFKDDEQGESTSYLLSQLRGA